MSSRIQREEKERWRRKEKTRQKHENKCKIFSHRSNADRTFGAFEAGKFAYFFAEIDSIFLLLLHFTRALRLLSIFIVAFLLEIFT